MWCRAAQGKRWGARQYWIGNILKVISHTWGGSSGYLTWRLMKEKICPPLMLQILHSSCFTISAFHSLFLISVLSRFLFPLFLTQTHIKPLTDTKQYRIHVFSGPMNRLAHGHRVIHTVKFLSMASEIMLD